jgi:hypothetical protein
MNIKGGISAGSVVEIRTDENCLRTKISAGNSGKQKSPDTPPVSPPLKRQMLRQVNRVSYPVP